MHCLAIAHNFVGTAKKKGATPSKSSKTQPCKTGATLSGKKAINSRESALIMNLPHYFVTWRDKHGDKHLTLVIIGIVGSCEQKSFRAMILKGGKVVRLYHEWPDVFKSVDAYGYGVYEKNMKRTLGLKKTLDKLKTTGTNSIVSTMDIELPFQVDEVFYTAEDAEQCWGSVGGDYLVHESSGNEQFVIELVKQDEAEKIQAEPGVYFAERTDIENHNEFARMTADDMSGL